MLAAFWPISALTGLGWLTGRYRTVIASTALSMATPALIGWWLG